MAMEHEKYPIYGVQFHPGVSYDTERIYDDKKLYRKAVNYADTGGAEND